MQLQIILGFQSICKKPTAFTTYKSQSTIKEEPCHIFLGLPFLQHLDPSTGFPCAVHVLRVTQGVTSTTDTFTLTFEGGWRLMLSQICSQALFVLFKYMRWCGGEGRTGAGARGRTWGHLFLVLLWSAQECSDGQWQVLGRTADLIKQAGYTGFQCSPKSKRKHRRVNRSKINVFWLHQRLGFLVSGPIFHQSLWQPSFSG